MARPRKPTAVLELSGAYKEHPGRRHENEPKPSDGVGNPPDSLSSQEKLIWHEIVDMCEGGVFGKSDRVALEVMTKLFCEFRNSYEEFTAAKLNRLETLLARFGMTPSDRSKVVVPPADKKKSVYAEIEEEQQQGLTH